MDITLDSNLSAMVDEFVASGEFATADDVISEALRLLASQTEDVEYLRAEIAKGIEDIEAGRVTTISTAEDRRALLDRIERNGRALLRSEQH